MRSRAGAVAGAVAALAGAAAALAVVLTRDDGAPARGELIAYSCRERDNDWFAVCVMRADGTEKRHLTEGLETSSPAWSPDGQRIAFTRNEDVGEFTTFAEDDVFVMRVEGGDAEQLTEEVEGAMSGQPTWSPDGREIAFVRGESVATTTPSRFGDLLAIGVDGKGLRTVVPGPAAWPDWSPDGRELVYTAGGNLARPDATMDLHLVPAAGGEARQLTRTPRSFETAAAWSPDGSLIAFARWTNATPFDGKASLHVIVRTAPASGSWSRTSTSPPAPRGSRGARTAAGSRSRRPRAASAPRSPSSL